MPNYIKLGNLRIEIPEPANNGGGGGGGGGGGEGLLSGLLAFYNLSDLTDASGNNRTLTNNGNVSFASGKIGNAAVFDGSNLLTYPQLFMSGASAFSFACYVKCTSSTTYIYGEDAGSTLLLISTHDNKATFNFMDGWNPIQSSSTITDNQWHHLACVYDGASSVAKVYFDGTEESSRNSVAATLPISDAPNFGLGGPPSGWGAKLQGSIDAAGLWSRALTSAEVAELYNAGAGKEHPFA